MRIRNGRIAKIVTTTIEQSVTTTGTVYKVNSTALGGVVIEDVNAQGVRTQQHVYTSGGTELATGNPETTMVFKHIDPVTRTEQGSWTNAADSYRTELDPMDGDVGTYQPVEDDPGRDFPMRHGSLSEPMNLCSVDFLPSDCQTMLDTLNGENATLLFARGGAPGGGGSQRVVYDSSGKGHLLARGVPGHETFEWKWINVPGEEPAYGPVPTSYSGTSDYESDFGSLSVVSNYQGGKFGDCTFDTRYKRRINSAARWPIPQTLSILRRAHNRQKKTTQVHQKQIAQLATTVHQIASHLLSLAQRVTRFRIPDTQTQKCETIWSGDTRRQRRQDQFHVRITLRGCLRGSTESQYGRNSALGSNGRLFLAAQPLRQQN